MKEKKASYKGNLYIPLLYALLTQGNPCSTSAIACKELS